MKHYKKLLILWTLCFVGGWGSISAQPGSESGRVGVSSERLQRISQTMTRHINGGRISGAVTLTAREGEVVHFEAHGLMDTETARPMSKDALFVLASMTKPVTAVAVLMLTEEGLIRLTDPVSAFVPEFKEIRVAVRNGEESEPRLVEAEREITVLDLLTFTSGLGSGGIGMQAGPEIPWPAEPGITLAQHVPRWAEVPLDFQPGTRWSYSPHAGMDLLARIVEVATGRSFQQFLEKRIFEPLEMNDTFFVLPENRRDRLAPIYEVTGEGELKKADYDLIPLAETYDSGSIGLISTAEDFFRFAQMLLNGGKWNGKQLLSPPTVERMTQNHVGDMFEGQLGRPGGMEFGLSVEIIGDPVRAGTFCSKGSFGWGGSYGSYFRVDPEKELVTVLMIHTSTSVFGQIQRDFDTAVMQALIR